MVITDTRIAEFALKSPTCGSTIFFTAVPSTSQHKVAKYYIVTLKIVYANDDFAYVVNFPIGSTMERENISPVLYLSRLSCLLA